MTVPASQSYFLNTQKGQNKAIENFHATDYTFSVNETSHKFPGMNAYGYI